MEFWVPCGNDSTLNHWSNLLSRLTMKLFYRASVLRSNFGTSPMYSWFPRLSISMKIRGCSTALLAIIAPTVTSDHHFLDQLRAGGCDIMNCSRSRSWEPSDLEEFHGIIVIVIIAPYPWCWYMIMMMMMMMMVVLRLNIPPTKMVMWGMVYDIVLHTLLLLSNMIIEHLRTKWRFI